MHAFVKQNFQLSPWKLVYLACILLFPFLTACQFADKALKQHPTFNIWPGDAPGSEDWTIEEQAGFRSITNVTIPTLTVFEPDPSLATGTAMIVCPGGGFSGLMIGKEGVMVAEWLAARGVTAFVLKYRVRQNSDTASPSSEDDFDERAKALESGRKIAAADGVQAMRFLRAHASEFKINPDHIGMMGFSAGAMTTMSVVLSEDAEDRPNIAASIYGAMSGTKAPEDGPPLFLVHAEDDAVVPVAKSLIMESAWQKAALPVELHLFDKGGHGFGAEKQGQPSDDWMNKFERWLLNQEWITASVK